MSSGDDKNVSPGAEDIKVQVWCAAENSYIEFTICAAGVELYKQHKWFAVKKQRIKEGRINYRMITKLISTNNLASFHALLLKCTPPLMVDHVDQNSLNNKLSNLRIVTGSQNNANMRKTTAKRTSVFKGVFRRNVPCRRPWRAQIKVNGKNHAIGSYYTEEEAARAYDKEAIKYFGEFAGINFPVSK